MPDFWSHIIGGELILKQLEDHTLKRIIQDNKKIFNLGCQGPDLFFYNDFWPWIKEKRGPEIATKLHQKNIKSLFIESINYLKNNRTHKDFSFLLSYFAGFLAHYTVDKMTHPFVFAKQKNSKQHKLLEINLDTYLVKDIWNKKAYNLSPTSRINLGKNLPAILIDYYIHILDRSHNHSTKNKVINDSYRDLKKVLNIFYSPYKIKKIAFKSFNPISPINLKTLSYPTKINHNILTEEDYLHFKELLLAGVDEGIRLIKITKDYLQDELNNSELKVAFEEINFEGELIK
ncbi:zinc dependent phospholipase C family protein [Orenia marismortui]|uniref:zinc dependent phospholipase C family protein n=1 Tax=Orenia marismortui TaxID=46469 RepID=UPI0003816074|nr:zinc dependent phospholipase C family protein [Orenia marismortui]